MKKIKLWLTVRHCQSTQIHSHDEDNVQEKVKTLRLVNEVIKLNVFNDFLSLVNLTK